MNYRYSNMNQLLIAIGGLIIAVLPAAYEWYRCWRLRKLAESRLLIAQSTTKMQRLLMDGIIRHGQICHDKVFPLMQKTQHMDELPLRWMFFPKAPSEEGRIFVSRLEKELKELPEEAKRCATTFIVGLVRACRHRHPVQFWSLLALCVFLRILMQSGKLRKAYAQAKAETRRQVLARAYDATNSQPALIPSMA